ASSATRNRPGHDRSWASCSLILPGLHSVHSLPGVPLGMLVAQTVGVPLNARVLVADDDAEFLDVVAEGLTRLGADVIRARNGAELIDHLAEHGPFDLVVTDIAMPWMTGLREP